MVRNVKAWMWWSVMFLCACSAAVPSLPVQQRDQKAASVLVVRPAGYQPVQITRDEFKDGMRMLFSRGPLPGVPRGGSPRFILVSTDPWQLQKAAGYLQHCELLGKGRVDCWEVLTPAGGLDKSGTRDVALRFAFAEAIQDAAAAVGSLTPDQVRAILGMALVGTIVMLVSPDPVTKYICIVTSANLIAFVGVDLFNNLVQGYRAMARELEVARDFAQVRAAGERYGKRLGPTLARIVMMVATYGVAKFAGLFPGSARSLPGGSRAAALAEAQGFRIPAVEGARSITLAADGTVTIDLGSTAAMAAVSQAGHPGKSVEEELFDPNEEHDSKVLAENMKKAKIPRPPGTAAHHIVAGGARAAERARNVLAKFGIGINEAENGVFLPCNTKTPCEAPGSTHSTLHTNTYYAYVNKQLLLARSRAEAVEALANIRARLLAGWRP